MNTLKKLMMSLLVFMPMHIFAANTSQLNVSANLQSGCKIHMDDIHIGIINGIVKDIPINTSITSQCSKSISYTIKTPVAGLIYSPIDGVTEFTYIYPIYHSTEPSIDYIGYRILIKDSTFRIGVNEHFGDGTKNYKGFQSSYIRVPSASGEILSIPLTLNYWTYNYLKPGNYSASKMFTLEF